jgi:hypothetical protein
MRSLATRQPLSSRSIDQINVAGSSAACRRSSAIASSSASTSSASTSTSSMAPLSRRTGGGAPTGPRASAPTARKAQPLCAPPRSATTERPSVVFAEFPTTEPGRFNEECTSFTQEFAIRGYEVSPNQRSSVVTVANLLQVRCSERRVGIHATLRQACTAQHEPAALRPCTAWSPLPLPLPQPTGGGSQSRCGPVGARREGICGSA